jgi:putative thioredoxin
MRQARINVTIIDQGTGAGAGLPPDLIKDTTTQTFVKDVIEDRSASLC